MPLTYERKGEGGIALVDVILVVFEETSGCCLTGCMVICPQNQWTSLLSPGPLGLNMLPSRLISRPRGHIYPRWQGITYTFELRYSQVLIITFQRRVVLLVL